MMLPFLLLLMKMMMKKKKKMMITITHFERFDDGFAVEHFLLDDLLVVEQLVNLVVKLVQSDGYFVGENADFLTVATQSNMDMTATATIAMATWSRLLGSCRLPSVQSLPARPTF